jgi:hypothetical protein
VLLIAFIFHATTPCRNRAVDDRIPFCCASSGSRNQPTASTSPAGSPVPGRGRVRWRTTRPDGPEQARPERSQRPRETDAPPRNREGIPAHGPKKTLASHDPGGIFGNFTALRDAGVAQSAEHRFCKPTVVSSTLTASSVESAPVLAEGHDGPVGAGHSPGGYPSGQRGQTVNLVAQPSQVRILLHPLPRALRGGRG